VCNDLGKKAHDYLYKKPPNQKPSRAHRIDDLLDGWHALRLWFRFVIYIASVTIAVAGAYNVLQ